jgi:hypothetical protein
MSFGSAVKHSGAGVLVVASIACGDDERAWIGFSKRVIDSAYRSEGVTVFDVDRDGALDLVTSELWYAGPSFEPRELRAPRTWDPLTEYCTTFGTFHSDVDKDGFEDLIVIGEPGAAASWCRNPQGADRHWDCHLITPYLSGESPFMQQILANSDPVLFGAIEPELQMGWLAPGPDPTQPWPLSPVTDRNFPYAARYEHGLGLGDLNRDLRRDILTGSGWLEQPAEVTGQPWSWHPLNLCPNNCSHMFSYDINGDGLVDLFGSSPHGYGVWWWEQLPTVLGAEIAFEQHEIDASISQTHAVRIVDLDGDRVPEIVTGKRWYAHFTQDIGALEPAMLVAYKAERSPDAIAWQRYEIDEDSGVGTQFEALDVTADGLVDIVVANKKGLMVFEQINR